MNGHNRKMLILTAILTLIAISLVLFGGCAREKRPEEGSSQPSAHESLNEPNGSDSSPEGAEGEIPYYSASPDELLTEPIDDHYLRDIKDISRWEVFDKDGKIVEEYVNSYEFATREYSEPIGESAIANLVERGLSEEKAKEMTVGEYHTHIGNLPMDGWYVPILEKYGLTEADYKNWKNIDAKNFRHEKEFRKYTYEHAGKERLYTDEQIEKFNSFGITSVQLNTLDNLGFTAEDLMKMTKEEVWHILNSIG